MFFCIPLAMSVEFEKETGIESMESVCLLKAGFKPFISDSSPRVLTAHLQGVR